MLCVCSVMRYVGAATCAHGIEISRDRQNNKTKITRRTPPHWLRPVQNDVDANVVSNRNRGTKPYHLWRPPDPGASTCMPAPPRSPPRRPVTAQPQHSHSTATSAQPHHSRPESPPRHLRRPEDPGRSLYRIVSDCKQFASDCKQLQATNGITHARGPTQTQHSHSTATAQSQNSIGLQAPNRHRRIASRIAGGGA